MNKLNEIIKIADIHASKIELAIMRLGDVFPLDQSKVTSLSEQELLFIELLISRFGKLQDFMGRILINSFLKYAGDYYDSMTMIDKINKLEKLGLIENSDIWEKLREVRNHIEYEYPDYPALTAKYLNQIFDLAPVLIKILHNIKDHSKSL